MNVEKRIHTFISARSKSITRQIFLNPSFHEIPSSQGTIFRRQGNKSRFLKTLAALPGWFSFCGVRILTIGVLHTDEAPLISRV
ncbi:hypothetical protein SCFA_20060 [anaerobic digester metagenome]|uniref:Uncharacterized protein n=1 Tax=anaerobic digester metagenome TaxID=1263854 RepID=A0A485LXX3_9ZZZZ